jgi:tight adherence protein B
VVPSGPAGRITPVIEEALRIATRSGLPPAELVRRAAREQRRRAAVAHSRATRRLEVRLVLPAGLCLLPAFVLVGVVPVIIDLLGG